MALMSKMDYIIKQCILQYFQCFDLSIILYLTKFILLILTVNIFSGLDMRIVSKAMIFYWVLCISHQRNLDFSLMMKFLNYKMIYQPSEDNMVTL
jgi:hypothetical protein